jgi:hypothetical protein
MAAKLERTNTPGIFRRHAKECPRGARCDCSYVVVCRHRGRQATETFRTLAEAREAKRTRESDAASGQFAPLARVLLHDYARATGSSATRAPEGAAFARRRATTTGGCSTVTRCVISPRDSSWPS